jgi:hypothetical protein
MYVSDLDQVLTPQLFYTYFYNHAHRLRLEKPLYLGLSRSSNGFFNHFRIQMAVSLLKPPNGYIFNGHIFNGHSPTDASARSGVTVM